LKIFSKEYREPICVLKYEYEKALKRSLPSSSSEDEDETVAPPQPPPRPLSTMSINTKRLTVIEPLGLVEEANEENSKSKAQVQMDANGVARRVRSAKGKMSDEEVYSRLRKIVSVGDPDLKYRNFKKIGQVNSASC